MSEENKLLGYVVFNGKTHRIVRKDDEVVIEETEGECL